MLTDRLQRLLHVLAGVAIFGIAGGMQYLLGSRWNLWMFHLVLLCLGTTFVVFGFRAKGPVARASSVACFVVLALTIPLVLGELVLRVFRFDFARSDAEVWSLVPPYYRVPTVPSGPVFFRRPGPEVWSGQVLASWLDQQGVTPNPYREAPPTTISYSQEGFRNPETLRDWVIAVTGDSFTELGYLPGDALFTSVLRDQLGVEVKNLGVSFTGPLTQLHYLTEYGLAPNTRHAVVVFYEGNDLVDLEEESQSLNSWRAGVSRPLREFVRQSSLLTQLARIIRIETPGTDWVHGYFGAGKERVPITLDYMPPEASSLDEASRERVERFFEAYEAFGREHGIVTWLAYMPVKRRVLHGLIEFDEGVSQEMRDWQPSDLPEFIADMAARHHVRFIDLIEPMVDETRLNRRLLYNAIWDTHLNADGSEVVGRTLASPLAPLLQAGREGKP
jgi:hypothetical protein